jgi:hypothetical protein
MLANSLIPLRLKQLGYCSFVRPAIKDASTLIFLPLLPLLLLPFIHLKAAAAAAGKQMPRNMHARMRAHTEHTDTLRHSFAHMKKHKHTHTTLHSLRYSWLHRRGTWDPSGTFLWVPHSWLPLDPLKELFDTIYAPRPPSPPRLLPAAPGNIFSSVAPTAAAAVNPQLSDAGHTQQLQPRTVALQWEGLRALGSGVCRGGLNSSTLTQPNFGASLQPCVAALDGRVGGTTVTSSHCSSSKIAGSSSRQDRLD